MKIVTVIPLQKGAFKTDLTYFTAKDIKNGSIVSIPIRNKKILGLVIFCQDLTDIKTDIKDMSFKLKKITEIKKHSIFKDEFISSALELSSYFISKKNSAIISLIPSLFREKYDEIEKFSKKDTTEISQKNYSYIKNEKLLFQRQLEDRISFYKTLIRGNFALKKSVFIILPTEYDIKIFYELLSKGIENFTFCMYSGLKDKKIIENYEKIINSSHGILILGTAQFLSIPREDLGAIIVEHESSNAYKMIPKPHFDLRIFAELYASKIDTKFILSDTLLRYETIGRKEIDGFGEVYPISFRINKDETLVKIIDPNTKEKNTQTLVKKSFKIFSEESIKEIQNTLKDRKNIFVFSLRKGLATYTICKDCNETINCEKCLAPVVLYLTRDAKKRMFVCNKCNTEKSPETLCPNCGSWNLMPLGIGTETVFEELKEKFPKTKIFKLDKESAKNATSANKIVKEFYAKNGSLPNTEGKILVGTEMAFYYLKEKVDLSIIASFDGLWTIPNYKMSEKIIQLLISTLQITEKKLIIQTKNENDSTLLAFKSENLLHFVREELEDRKKLNYPPYKRFIKITYTGDKNSSLQAKKILRELFEEYEPEIFSSFIAKSKDQYITNALLKINPQKWSLSQFSIDYSIDKKLSNLLYSLPPNYEISVDPEDLL